MTANDDQMSLLKRVLRSLVPRRLRAERGVFLRLEPRAGRAYLKLRLLDAVGFGGSSRRRVPLSARSFLFVCFGNIMRSPMAEQMFKRALGEHAEGIRVRSAGIHATAGSEAHPRAQVAARELGLPLDAHRSQLLTSDMVEEADAIFAMDFQNKAELLALFSGAKNKIFMLGTYADGGVDCEIPDPYFGDQDEARRCYRLLQSCIDNLVASLWSDHDRKTGKAPSSQAVSTQV